MNSLIIGPKLNALLDLLRSVKHLDGAIAELGVYKGGTLDHMARICPDKTCYGFDTFSGQPAASWRPIDFHKPGEFADTSVEVVQHWMPPNVILKLGWFPDTARDVHDRFCFAHVDMDLEKSTEDAIKWLRPRMVAGGIVVFDDYHWRNCDGVATAIERAGLRVVPTAPYQCCWTAEVQP